MLRAGQRKVRNRITRLESNAETLVKNIPLRHNIDDKIHSPSGKDVEREIFTNSGCCFSSLLKNEMDCYFSRSINTFQEYQ